MNSFNRRDFLKFLGLSSTALALNSCSSLSFLNSSSSLSQLNAGLSLKSVLGEFEAIAASESDELVLDESFTYNIIRSWGDKILNANHESIDFGYNNDYVEFLPLAEKEALLFVNHESVNPLEVIGEKAQRKVVGVSIFKIIQNANSEWVFDEDINEQKKYNWTVDANRTCRVSGPVVAKYPEMKGTLANCSGGKTLWGTILTCEENYHNFKDLYHWQDFDMNQYGWIVEIDPYTKNSIPVKRTSLGKIAHENAALALADDEKVVAYMGDDKENEHIYKFVSSKALNDHDRDYLAEGKLYVAKFDKDLDFSKSQSGLGTWELLSVENPKLTEHFDSDAELLLETRRAAKLLGASATDRPEGIAISPKSKDVFVSLTNNKTKANSFGSVFKISETNHDHGALSFKYENFALGGENSGFACPDNLRFTSDNSLWVATDISSKAINKKEYKFHGNNSLFVIPLNGEYSGKALRFASAPKGAELCGISFDEKSKTLFLSVQHPGELGTQSHWPNLNNDKKARSSVVAIRKK